MVRTRSAGGSGDGDVDWAKFLYDDVGELVTEEVSVIPKNIVSERRKRLEGLLSNRDKELEPSVDSDCGAAKFRTISQSVEKRHAVLCFDPNADAFSVKDLNTTNGSYINNRRISSDRSETLNNMDLLRFGFVRLGTASAGPEIQQNDQNVTYLPAATHSRSNSGCGGEITIGGGSTSQSSHVMQQSGGGVRGNSLYGSRVSSPSLTLDSGRGSSSAPSSPAKEMSPVPGPISTHHSNSLLYSPNLSRKMTKASSEPKQNRLQYTSGCRTNSQEQIAPLLRKDSLEDAIDNRNDNSVFPQSKRDCKSAVIGDLDDLNVPNEVFDEQLEPKLEMLASSVTKRDGAYNSRPHSQCGIDIAPNAHYAPESSATNVPTTPTPLYGTPHWWPQTEDDNDDQFSAAKLCEEATSNDGDDCRPQSLITGGDTEPISINSDSNMSMDSDTSLDKKKIAPMAFTVDFDDGPKKFGITDSISKFAPKHRRNISLTRSEDSSKRNSDTPALKKEPTSLTPNSSSSNNKSVIESDTDLTAKQNVSKCFSSKFTKGKPVTSKLMPVCTSDNNKISQETENCSTSFKKYEDEVLNDMNKPKSSLFSRLKSSQRETKSNATVSGGLLKNKLDPQISQKTVKAPPKTENPGVGTTTTMKSLEKMDNSTTKDVDKDVDDASSETGTYTVELEEPAVGRARKNIAKMLGVTSDMEVGGGAVEDERTISSTAPEWVREWVGQAAILNKKNKDLNPASDTQLLLQETENVVSAMQARVTRQLSNNSSHNSDSDDEATLSHNSPSKLMNRFKRPNTLTRNVAPTNSPMRLPREASVLSDSGYQVGYQSDSSNDGIRECRNIGGVKMNKAFNIRRGRVVGYDSDGCTALGQQSLAAPTRGISPRPSGSVCSASGILPTTPANSQFSRNDGGRFSLRMSKSKILSHNQAPPPPMMAAPLRPSAKPSGIIQGSSSNKIDLNAKRRQSQTPSVPYSSNIVNSRKPPTGSRSNSTLTAKEVEMANWRRRKSYDPLKAAADARKKRGTSSAFETTLDDISPTSMSNQSAAFMSKTMSFHSESQFPTKCPSEEEDMIYVVDEVDSSHSNSPIHVSMSRSSHDDGNYYGMANSHCSMRPKNKLEALDNLVIATIHSLSNKVRASSRNLLEKLQIQHVDNENGALLEEMVSQLKELELSSSNSSPNKSPSRELSGTLKNLKKLEQVILVLDRVLCDDSGSDANN